MLVSMWNVDVDMTVLMHMQAVGGVLAMLTVPTAS